MYRVSRDTLYMVYFSNFVESFLPYSDKLEGNFLDSSRWSQSSSVQEKYFSGMTISSPGKQNGERKDVKDDLKVL